MYLTHGPHTETPPMAPTVFDLVADPATIPAR